MLTALVFMTVAIIVQRYLLSFTAVRIDAGTLDYLTRRLLALPMTYFTSRRTGDIQRRLSGLRQVREFMVQSAVAGLTSLVQLGASLALMLAYSPLLAGVFLVTAPLYLGLMRFSSQRLRPRRARRLSANSPQSLRHGDSTGGSADCASTGAGAASWIVFNRPPPRRPGARAGRGGSTSGRPRN